MRELDPNSAAAEMKSDPAVIYVDVRTQGEYDQGHPDGAWNLPILFVGMLGMRPNSEFLEVASRVLPKEAPLLLGCKSGQRSAMACQMLAQAGWTNLANISGGFHGGGGAAGWLQCGLPSSSTPTPGRSWDELKAQP